MSLPEIPNVLKYEVERVLSKFSLYLLDFDVLLIESLFLLS